MMNNTTRFNADPTNLTPTELAAIDHAAAVVAWLSSVDPDLTAEVSFVCSALRNMVK